MDASPEPPPLPASPPALAGNKDSPLWKACWVALTVVLALLAVPAGCNGMEALGRFAGVASEIPEGVSQFAGLILAFATVVVVGTLGLRHGWHNRWPARCALALIVTGSVAWSVAAARRALRDYHDRVALGCTRPISASADQFFRENPHRLFVAFDQLVGADKYVKAVNPIEGEDLRALFPMRRDLSDYLFWVLTLPDGRKIGPMEKAEPKPDGLDVENFSDGRFEITYHGGVPDGPFRAYYRDGKPWSEATYVHGRVVGPVWLYTRDGRKLDELAPGVDVEAAMQAGADAATSELRKTAGAK